MTLKAQREARIAAKLAEKRAAILAEKARIEANPIYAAIAPQRSEAILKAVQFTRSRLLAFAEKFQTGDDFKVAAPSPSSFKHGRETYRRMLAFRNLASRVLVIQNGPWPEYTETVVGINLAGIDRLCEEAADEAAASFDAYVAKLTQKVGECDAAAVTGALWQESLLVVRKGDAVERWKTQQILNFSVYGKAFNQWPSRKVK